MPQSPVTATLSDEDDGFMDLLDGENLKVLCVFLSVPLTMSGEVMGKNIAIPPRLKLAHIFIYLMRIY